jgi:hypothetical protein
MHSFTVNEGPILIIGIPNSTEILEGLDLTNAGLNLSTLLVIHKTLTRFAIDWEIGTCDGQKAWINQDNPNEESKEFYRNVLGKINSPINLEEIKGNEYRGMIVPSMTGLMGSFESKSLVSRLSKTIKQLYLECKVSIFSGYGILGSFECENINHNWLFEGFNIASISLIQQSNEEKFQNFPYIIEDKIRELGGNFCWNDKTSDLLVLDRRVISVQNDYSIRTACNTFGYLISERN